MFWYDKKLINSDQLQLNINNLGLCFGATVFSTMRVYDHLLTHPLTSWIAHCDRLKTTIEAFNWQQPHWQSLEKGASLLAQHFPVIRLTVFPDGKELITGRSLPPDLEKRQTQGIIAWVAQDSLYRRELPQYKTGNYLSAYLARNQALSLNAQEAILVDAEGHWLETSTGNLWGWKNDCWYTPSLDTGILPGIARSRWLNFWRNQNIQVQENIWTIEFVQTLETLGYSNCVIDFIPIKTVINTEKKITYQFQQLSNRQFINHLLNFG